MINALIILTSHNQNGLLFVIGGSFVFFFGGRRHGTHFVIDRILNVIICSKQTQIKLNEFI